jgi:serine protease
LTGDTHLLEVDDREGVLAELRARPEVVWAEPEAIRRRSDAVVPNDELYGLQWALPAIHAPAAWARTTGTASVVVAVIDTGILEHPDLAGRLVAGWDFVSDPVSAADGDGRDPDPTDTGERRASSSMLHGVHVAGIIGAIADNHLGVAGLDWGCRIQPIRALGVDEGKGVDSDIADAIRWAAGLHVEGVPDNATPADVINLSFDGRGTSHAMQDAVDDARARGVVVVAAAGNEAALASSYAPAGLDGVIAVGAADETLERAAYSNFGPKVTLLAPGGLARADAAGRWQGILSTTFMPSSGWSYIADAGTSQAAPYVAATISLMKALDPALTPRLAEALLVASADPGSRCAAPDGSGPFGCGAGLLDVDGALALAEAQAGCAGRCTSGEMCRAGHCESLPISIGRVTGCTAAGAPVAHGARWLVIALALGWAGARMGILRGCGERSARRPTARRRTTST